MGKFDLNQTRELFRLLAVPNANRDEAWRKDFFSAAVNASMVTDPEQVMIGPDGFPYFKLRLPEPGKEITPFCISHILDFCLENGIGVSINPHQDGADWVFRYSDLWNLKAKGSLQVIESETSDDEDLRKTVAESSGSQLEVRTPKSNREVFIGAPSQELLPNFARESIKGFLKRLQIYSDRSPLCFLLVDPNVKPERSLVFNFFPEDFSDVAEYHQVMHLLSWYIPSWIGLIGIEKNSDMNSNFGEF
jgi:hypothetical protein